jgi:hypothetical protein
MDSQTSPHTFTVFAGPRRLASGSSQELVAVLRTAPEQGGPVLVFDDASGQQVELAETEPIAPRGPGRPKLGVVSREVTLLPRHWEWLFSQPGGASVALRKLVDDARRGGSEADRKRKSQEAAYRFMSAMAGNEAGFEEAARSLFAGDAQRFKDCIATWPEDVARHAIDLAAPALAW